eukprot:6707942-Pyramimonas_sp.AAC.1
MKTAGAAKQNIAHIREALWRAPRRTVAPKQIEALHGAPSTLLNGLSTVKARPNRTGKNPGGGGGATGAAGTAKGSIPSPRWRPSAGRQDWLSRCGRRVELPPAR